LVCDTENVYIACIAPFFIGIFLIPALPIIIELSIELVFPTGEAMTVGKKLNYYIYIFKDLFLHLERDMAQ